MPKKRANGAGYITKLSGKRRKPYYVYAPTTYEVDENTGEKKQVRKMLGHFKTKTEAEVFLSNWNLENNPNAVNEEKITVSDVVALYLDRLEKERKPQATINNNKSSSNHINETILQKPIKDVTYKEIQANVDELADIPSSQNNFKIFLNHIWNLAIMMEYTQANPVPNVRTVEYERDKTKKRTLTERNIRDMWVLTKSRNLIWRRNAIWCLLLTYTGMRARELFLLKCKDINPEECYAIGGVKTKASKNRYIIFHYRVVNLMRQLLKEAKTDYLIELPDRSEKTLSNKVSNLSVWMQKKFGVSSHACRRTFMTRAYKSERKPDFFIIESVAGHRVPQEGFASYVELEPQELVEEVNKIRFIWTEEKDSDDFVQQYINNKTWLK